MKKYLSILLTIFIIGYFTPVACGDAGFLSGTGGEGEEAPTEEVVVVVEAEPPVEEPAPTEAPNKELESAENPVNSISTPDTADVSNFLLPKVVINLSGDNEYLTAVSIPPMGTADYKVTSPGILQAGEESYIELLLTPYTFAVNKNQTSKEGDRGILQFIEGDLLIYPRLKAELVAGSSFSVSSVPASDQIITLDNPTTWIWYITALKPGEHKILVNISVPVSNAGTIEDFPLETIEFYINILSPTPTPTNTSTPIPTSTPLPTSTPIPSIGTQLSGNAVSIAIAIIAALGAILAGIINLVKTAIDKKKEEDKNILDKIEKAKKDKEIIAALKKPKKQK